jgi:hypothetical protein
LRRHAGELPAPAVNALLADGHRQVAHALERALGAPTAATPPATDAPPGSWPGWTLLERRVRLLRADAVKIVIHSQAIVRQVG